MSKSVRRKIGLCRQCHDAAVQHIGGAEVETTLLFAYVRGSTTLAERMSASEFSRVINRYYAAANHVLVKTDAFIDHAIYLVLRDEARGKWLCLKN